jgi:molybdenum cofactor biosynthesis protein A
MLYDNHNRPINYLRLAVTDRCNLRCFYCMPEEGIKYVHRTKLLSYEEMLRLSALLGSMGVNKVRITGGEPFVRHNLIDFLWQLSDTDGINEIAITTNGILTAQYIPAMKAMGIRTVNLSLDTLDNERFFKITRRNEFAKVRQCLDKLLENDFEVKINAVVMDGQNTEDILPLVALTRDANVSVRFIEEMPFNGEGAHYPKLEWNFKKILSEIQSQYPDIAKIADPQNSTSYNYQIPNHRGTVGIIAAFSRTFCGTCNRIRITAQGDLKTCLYDNGVLNVRDLLREYPHNEPIKEALLKAFGNRPKDGFEAEALRSPVSESMSTIGG